MERRRFVVMLGATAFTLGCALNSPMNNPHTFLLGYGAVPGSAAIAAAMRAGCQSQPSVIITIRMLSCRSVETQSHLQASAGADSVSDLGTAVDPEVELYLTTSDSVTAADKALLTPYALTNIVVLHASVMAAMVRVSAIDPAAEHPRFVAVGIVTKWVVPASQANLR